MSGPIQFRFDCHGLGDCVHAATALRLYQRAGYDVSIAVENNKRWVWKTAGVPIYNGPERLPLHPYYYPSDFFDLSKPDHTHSKIAHFFEIRELPKLGDKQQVWDMVCAEHVDASESVSLTALAEAALIIRDLPRPVVLLHTKGSNWQEKKSIPDADAFAVIRELLDVFDGSVITLDWDSRSPTLDHSRCRAAGRITTEVFGALCMLSDLLIGIDSGPLHLARWFPIKTLYVTREIPPVRCCLPSPRATFLVSAKQHDHWEQRRPLWELAEFAGDTATVRDIVVTAHYLLEIDSDQLRPRLAIDPENVPGVYTYHRLDHDQRTIELLPYGRVGIGAAGCERRWSVDVIPSGHVLTLANENGDPTCHLRLDPDGTYRGSWLRHERMKIELTPKENES